MEGPKPAESKLIQRLQQRVGWIGCQCEIGVARQQRPAGGREIDRLEACPTLVKLGAAESGQQWLPAQVQWVANIVAARPAGGK